MNIYYVLAIWIALALLASFISIRIGVSVALVEIVVGAVFGNIPGIKEHIQQNDVTILLAGFGSILLTFLAGAEIDPVSLRRYWKSSVTIGTLSFLLPLIGAFCFARFALSWNLHASEIAGIALSTTSVAVVYAVMVETGLNREDIGKLILAACFVTDLGTVLALGGLFASYGWMLLAFAVITVAAMFLFPRTLRWVLANVGHRVSEPEIRLIVVVLLALGGLATATGSEAVLPAYVAGLVAAGVFMKDRVVLDRIRTIAFAFLTPFFFLRAGTLISAPVLVSGAGVIAALFCVKIGAKFPGCVARYSRLWAAEERRHLHDAPDGHWADLRLDRGPVRTDASFHLRDAVHRACDRRDPLGPNSDADCRAVLPANCFHAARG
jgi:Kef-type K+ transport system membrane component KefB